LIIFLPVNKFDLHFIFLEMDILLSTLLFLSSASSPEIHPVGGGPSLPETVVKKPLVQRKCPEHETYKKALLEPNLTLEKINKYLLCFVYNQNIEIERRIVSTGPFVDPNDFVPMEIISIPMEGAFLKGSPELSTLVTIPSFGITHGLTQLLNDPDRGWAANVLLATITGKLGIVYSHASTPKEWWEKEGKTGKAKREWEQNFFVKPGYELYYKPGAYLFSCPLRDCEPPGRGGSFSK
jgi:hypothetical protein